MLLFRAKRAPFVTPQEPTPMLFSLSLSPSGAYLFTPVSSGGGGGLFADLNFETQTYTLNGGSVTDGAFFGENAVDWGTWNPATIVEGVGLVGGPQAAPVLIGPLLSFILTGATLVLDYGATGLGGNIFLDWTDFANFNVETGFSAYGANHPQVSAGSSNANVTNAVVAGDNRFAVTLSADRVVGSLNGGAVAVASDPGITPGSNIGMALNQNDVTLKRMRVYSPVADSDLPALSAIT